MSNSTTVKTPRVVRTPEQQAAYYQGKANAARAKAAKLAREQETKALILIGKAIITAIETNELRADSDDTEFGTLSFLVKKTVPGATANKKLDNWEYIANYFRQHHAKK